MANHEMIILIVLAVLGLLELTFVILLSRWNKKEKKLMEEKRNMQKIGNLKGALTKK